MTLQEEFNAYAYHLYRYGQTVAMSEWEQGFPNAKHKLLGEEAPDTIRLRDELEVTGDPGDTRAIRRDSHGVVARNTVNSRS